MATEAGRVAVAVTGSIAIADENQADPGSATTALPAEWTGVGFISEDGVVEANEKDTNDLIAWQNAETVRVVTTSKTVTYNFTMIETNAEALGLFYGKDVSATDTSHSIGGDATIRRAVCLTVVDGATVIRRWAPSCEVTEQGEVTFGSQDHIGYEVTLTAYPVANIDGASNSGSVNVHYSPALVSAGPPAAPPTP